VCARAYSWKRWLLDEAGVPDASVAAGATDADARRRPGFRIAARYELINEIGRGGMGVVWRALDRLTGRIVTVKQLIVPGNFTAADSNAERRATLAGEFQLLASLRHPNIITVLDYGFDEERQPFLVMDLQENARTIIEAGADTPLGVRVEFLAQALRALVYLHRIGIVHRDVKPENILVVGGQVKLLDFGLSVSRELLKARTIGWAGTPAYMAPELFEGSPPSEQSDLYAFGMVALELFSGAQPFDFADPAAAIELIRKTLLPRPQDDVDPRLRPVLERLLAKQPEQRYRDAGEVIVALGAALGRSISVETVSTRESFIEAAPFVGRQRELATLLSALREAVNDHGGTWLIGGESGVGKSRLLDELRTRALIDGIVSLRGQAMNRGGRPYHVWHDVVRYLLLRVDVDDATAEVLKTIVPDIGALLGRPIQDPPVVDSDASQARLLFAVEELFRSQPAPVVVILEDLQWAGSESLRLFAWLGQPATQLPLLVIGSYRNDEAQDVLAAAPGASHLELGRLSPKEVAELGAAMIGPAAHREGVRTLLATESEGIPFFVVEVIRVLAESAGSLDQIGEGHLPDRVLSGGIQRVIRRRLERLDRSALEPLKTAAVIGREIDLQLLLALHPELDVDAWTADCARAAVFELRDQRWRFAHDKLREMLDGMLSATVRRERHRRVAEATEVTYPGQAEYATALAVHWRAAEEPAREVVYARQAGVQALQNGAFAEGAQYLLRARDLMQANERGVPGHASSRRLREWLEPNAGVDPEGDAFARGLVESGLCEAYYRLGDLRLCREHGERALVWFGRRVPKSRAAWPLAALGEIAVRSAQKLLSTRSRNTATAIRVASEIARVQLRLVDVFFYSMQLYPLLWSSLRVVNQCEPAGRPPELAQGYAILGILAFTAGLERLGRGWSARGIAIAEASGYEREVAWTLTRNAVLDVSDAHFGDAESTTERSRLITERVGDLRLWEETRTLQSMKNLFAGEFERGLERYREVERLSRRSGNRQVECWSRMGQGVLLSRLGRDAEAISYYADARPLVDEDAMKSEAICLFGLLALSRLRTDDLPAAYEAADRALWHIRSMRPIAYWLQPALAAVAEVFLTLREQAWGPDSEVRLSLPRRGRQALAGVRSFARHVPVGRPAALLWEGLAAWLDGHEIRARRRWQRCIELSEQMGTPYERARAHLELGRHMSLQEEGRSYHLSLASDQFDRLGSRSEWTRAQAEITRSGDAIRGGA
jgi:tetratricopeptide (TPR) repeat protein